MRLLSSLFSPPPYDTLVHLRQNRLTQQEGNAILADRLPDMKDPEMRRQVDGLFVWAMDQEKWMTEAERAFQFHCKGRLWFFECSHAVAKALGLGDAAKRLANRCDALRALINESRVEVAKMARASSTRQLIQ